MVARVDERDGDRVTTVSVTVEIDAPPERVWQVVSNPANLPYWDRHIVRVIGVPDTGLERGISYVVLMRFMAVHARVHAQVLEWDAPRLASISLRGVLDAVVTSTVEPLDTDHSVLGHVVEYRFRGGPLGELVAGSLRVVGGAQLALRRGTLAQKRQIESGQPA